MLLEGKVVLRRPVSIPETTIAAVDTVKARVALLQAVVGGVPPRPHLLLSAQALLLLLLHGEPAPRRALRVEARGVDRVPPIKPWPRTHSGTRAHSRPRPRTKATRSRSSLWELLVGHEGGPAPKVGVEQGPGSGPLCRRMGTLEAVPVVSKAVLCRGTAQELSGTGIVLPPTTKRTRRSHALWSTKEGIPKRGVACTTSEGTRLVL